MCVLTRTVVSVRSCSRGFTLLADPPIKVIIGILGKLAGVFPLVFIHVETTSARQAKDVIYDKDRKMEEKSGTSGFNVVFLLTIRFPIPRNLFPISTHHSLSHPIHQHSRPCYHTQGGTRRSGH